MGDTLKANVIVPEVWADLAQAQFKNAAVVLPHAVQSNKLVGEPGDTIHFPKWDMIGDELDELTEDEPMVPATMGQTDGTAVVKEYGKAVRFSDQADLYGIGSPGDEARRQFGIMAARKMDSALIGAATAAGSLTATLADVTKLTWAEIVGGIAEIGDEWDPADFSGLFIRSELNASIMLDDQFLEAAKVVAGNEIIRKGFVGQLAGLNVYMTNRLPAATPGMLVKRGALGALYKRRPLVETDRDILARKNIVATTVHFAVKRLNDEGVVVFKAAGQ